MIRQWVRRCFKKAVEIAAREPETPKGRICATPPETRFMVMFMLLFTIMSTQSTQLGSVPGMSDHIDARRSPWPAP